MKIEQQQKINQRHEQYENFGSHEAITLKLLQIERMQSDNRVFDMYVILFSSFYERLILFSPSILQLNIAFFKFRVNDPKEDSIMLGSMRSMITWYVQYTLYTRRRRVDDVLYRWHKYGYCFLVMQFSFSFLFSFFKEI